MEGSEGGEGAVGRQDQRAALGRVGVHVVEVLAIRSVGRCAMSCDGMGLMNFMGRWRRLLHFDGKGRQKTRRCVRHDSSETVIRMHCTITFILIRTKHWGTSERKHH